VTALAGGGVVIGMYVPAFGQGGAPAPSEWSLAPSTYITVNPDNTFTIIAKNPETGQGIRAALPMIIADEFDVDWTQVKIQQGDLNAKYGPQSEGGSRAIPVNYDPMRQIGAGGRLMMEAASSRIPRPVARRLMRPSRRASRRCRRPRPKPSRRPTRIRRTSRSSASRSRASTTPRS
jgi:CO/xanthine dehydrogenase Mo-binding subunit